MTALLPIVSQAQATARYYFNDNFSAGIGLTFAGDTDSFGINARYEFQPESAARDATLRARLLYELESLRHLRGGERQ